MRNFFRRFSWMWIAVLLASCASVEELARRSQVELRAGNPEKAYRTAVTAIKHDPHNPKAIAALNAAATAEIEDWKRRIHGLYEADTLAAARQALQLRDFRREVVGFGGSVPPDTGFANFEEQVRTAAAEILYFEADGELRARRPKDAYLHFRAARDYAPGYRDLDQRMGDAYTLAVQRVAILPVENQTGVPELSRMLARRIWDEVSQHSNPQEMTFTRLVGPEEVYARMTVSELDDLSRDQAVRLGRRIGADRVVWGRIHSVHGNTNTDRYHETIFHRETERDSAGRSRERFTETDFSAVGREREVTASWEIEVLDVNEETSIANRAKDVSAVARTVYTNFVPSGNCDDYCLVPPEMKSRESDRARRVQEDWHQRFGNWTLPHLLDAARHDHSRHAEFFDVRSQFHRDTRNEPVYFDDLPGEGDLLMIALEDLWRPFLAVLKEQDVR